MIFAFVYTHMLMKPLDIQICIFYLPYFSRSVLIYKSTPVISFSIDVVLTLFDYHKFEF